MVFPLLERLKERRRAERQDQATSLFAVPDLKAQRDMSASRRVGVLVFTGVTTSEVDEPVHRLARRLDADVVHVALTLEAVVGVEPVRTVHVDFSVHDSPVLDVLVLPGGLGWQRLANDETAMQWVVHAAQRATGILTMSTGSLLLASAGRLVGATATGHWLARDALSELGVTVSTSRTAQSDDNRIVTASGATAALTVCDQLADRLRWGP